MTFHWENIHITGVNTGDPLLQLRRGLSIDGVRLPTDWDFSHLPTHINTILKNNYGKDVYIYGSVQSAYDDTRKGAQLSDKAPVMNIITLPSGCVPTRFVYVKVEGELRSFDDMGYEWVQVVDPCFNGKGKVYHLALVSSDEVIENEAEENEGTALYLMTSSDAGRDTKGRIKVEHVEFKVLDENEEEVLEEFFYPGHDDPPQDLYDGIIQEHFANSTPEDQTIARARIEEAAQTNIEGIRRCKNTHLQRMQCDVSELKLSMLLPVNYPASISGLSDDKYFHNYAKEHLQGEVACFSDHSSSTSSTPGKRGEYAHQLDEGVFDRLRHDFGQSSPEAILFSLLMADFLFATRSCTPENLRGRGMRGVDVLSEKVFDIFGVDRVLQFLGQNTSASDYKNQKPRLTENVRMICRNLVESFKRKGCLPSSASDFFLHFLWQEHPPLLHSVPGSGVDLIRFRANYDSDRTQNGLASLEVKFSNQRGANFVSIGMNDLREVYRDGGIENMLLRLLIEPAYITNGLSASFGAHPTQTPRDCLRAAVLAAPDQVLSPTGKFRAGAVFSDTDETSVQDFRSKLSSHVKTLRLKEIKSGQHHHAMNSNEVMVGVFGIAPQKHCVLIDGRRGRDATITDPALNKTVPRTNRSLKKLGINHFRHLFVLKRVEMSTKRRYQSQKELGLPFLPSFSDNDSKSAP